MNNIQIFNFKNNEFGLIRTLTLKGEPWFVGRDVAESLGYAEPRSAISKKVDAEDKGVAEMETPSGKQKVTIINESGLYSLIFGSKLESAKRFKRWVTSEVLPSIRKTGGYQKPATIAEQIGLLATGYGDHEDRIKNLESNMVIDYGQQQTLRQHVNKAVLNALGGKDTEAYAYISKVVFAECNRDLQDRFKVNSRNNIPRKRYEEAIDYVDNWEPKTNTKLRIDEYNRQQRFEV
jgi:prophage antirepressor-like protein